MMNTPHAKISWLTKLALAVTLLFWSSAFVGIRFGLESFSPGALALLRFIIGSVCLLAITMRLPADRNKMHIKDMGWLILIGALTLGVYHYCLNYGEMTVSSGIASFIIGQAPVVTTVLAILFLKERINLIGVLGLLISVAGLTLIMIGEGGALKVNIGCLFILASTLAGSVYSILQKHFLKRYHNIEVTAYIVWGGTLALLMFSPELYHQFTRASLSSTLAAFYLGIFPTAISYLTWGYALSQLSASRTMNFIYFMPLLTTLMGWIFLGEIPALLSLVGGLIALVGVWVVHSSDRIE